MLSTLQATAQQLSETNKILTNEASSVLEALWNGQQETVVQMTNIVERLNVLEDAAGIVPPEDKDEETQQPKETEDGPGDLSESPDGGGEGEICGQKEGDEPCEESPEEEPDAGDEGRDGSPGTGPNE